MLQEPVVNCKTTTHHQTWRFCWPIFKATDINRNRLWNWLMSAASSHRASSFDELGVRTILKLPPRPTMKKVVQATSRDAKGKHSLSILWTRSASEGVRVWHTHPSKSHICSRISLVLLTALGLQSGDIYLISLITGDVYLSQETTVLLFIVPSFMKKHGE